MNNAQEKNASNKRKRPDDSTMVNASHACDRATKYGYEIVSLHRWLDGWPSNAPDGVISKKPLPIVDLRSQLEFRQRHISLSPSTTDTLSSRTIIVNLPLSTLLSGERSCELPPRHVDFAILIPNQCITSFTTTISNEDSVAVHNAKKKECDDCIHTLFFATASQSTKLSRKPWLVRQVLLDNVELWDDARGLGIVMTERKEEKQQDNVIDGTDGRIFRKEPRLWKPDSLVGSDVLPLLKQRILEGSRSIAIAKCDNSIHATNMTTGVVLDLGSGAGRDVCYLAEELKDWYYHHYHPIDNQSSFCDHTTSSKSTTTITEFPLHFIGIDNHKGSSKRCLPLWKHRGVLDVTSSVNLNLEKMNDVANYLEGIVPKQRDGMTVEPMVVCIYAIRYWNKRLFVQLANGRLFNAHSIDGISSNSSNTSSSKTTATTQQHPTIQLPKGTILAISHFCKPTPTSGWAFDHPKESHVLERWELRDLFSNGIRVGRGADNDTCCWKIVKDEICMDGDHGRTLVKFVAVKMV